MQKFQIKPWQSVIHFHIETYHDFGHIDQVFPHDNVASSISTGYDEIDHPCLDESSLATVPATRSSDPSELHVCPSPVGDPGESYAVNGDFFVLVRPSPVPGFDYVSQNVIQYPDEDDAANVDYEGAGQSIEMCYRERWQPGPEVEYHTILPFHEP